MGTGMADAVVLAALVLAPVLGPGKARRRS